MSPSNFFERNPFTIKKLKSPSILKEKSFEKMSAFKFIGEIPAKFKNWNRFNFRRETFQKYLAFNFKRNIPLKFIWLTFNFRRGILLLFVGKKKSTLKFCVKNTGKSLYKIFLKTNPFNFFLKKTREIVGKKNSKEKTL